VGAARARHVLAKGDVPDVALIVPDVALIHFGGGEVTTQQIGHLLTAGSGIVVRTRRGSRSPVMVLARIGRLACG
jgi:hypothetical protein